MGPDILVPVSGMLMIIAIVGTAHASRTIRYYLDWRMRMADRQFGGGDKSLAQAIRELRAEVAALKQHEAEAVLSFDSTLQTMEARLKHLEGRTLAPAAAERAPVGAGTVASAESAPAEVAAVQRGPG